MAGSRFLSDPGDAHSLNFERKSPSPEVNSSNLHRLRFEGSCPDYSTEESEEKPKAPQEAAQEAISAYLSLIGKKGGLNGGPARAKRLSAKINKALLLRFGRLRCDRYWLD